MGFPWYVPSEAREEGQEFPYNSSQKNQGTRSPASKSRPQSSSTPYKSRSTPESDDLFSIETVGGLLSDMSISSSTAGSRASPSAPKPHSHSPSFRGRPSTPKHFGQDAHSESGGRTPNRSNFSRNFDAPSPTSLRPVHTMVSAGGITTSKVSIYVNAARCKLDTKKLSELLKFLVTHHIAPYKDPVSGIPTKKLRILKFDLSSNILDDSSIAKLVGFFRQHAGFITVNSLKLYQNKIGDAGAEALAELIARDDGPTLHELHLSHNRITTRGALAIAKSLAECPRYPFATTQEKKLTPLWLRLEHNFISAEQVIHFLEKSETPICQVNAKGSSCTPSHCQHAGAKLHLVFLHFQYWNEALESAKRALEVLRDAQPSDASPALTSGPVAATSPDTLSTGADLQQKPVSAVVGSTPASKKTQKISNGPLYLFMDTNAVVTAVLEPQHPWSFKNLAKRFGKSTSTDSKAEKSSQTRDKSKPDAQADPSSRVVLVVTDTVLGELDGMHKKKIIKAAVVNSILMEAEKDGYLMMLGAHQGEKLVQALDSGHSQLGLDVTTSNDRMIVDIALMFAEALGDANCAMFISEDHGARLAARNRGLCVVSMSQLQVVLAKRSNDVWTSSLLRQWFLAAAPTKSLQSLEGSTDSPAHGASSSNPISQLRALKSHTIKAREIAETLVPASLEMEEKHTELNAILREMENVLKRITLLPGLEGINGPLSIDTESTVLKSSEELENAENELDRHSNTEASEDSETQESAKLESPTDDLTRTQASSSADIAANEDVKPSPVEQKTRRVLPVPPIDTDFDDAENASIYVSPSDNSAYALKMLINDVNGSQSMYILQLLQHKSKKNEFFFFTKWGRVSSSSPNWKIVQHTSEKRAVDAFERTFQRLTHNSFESYLTGDFKKQENGFEPLDLDQNA